MAIPIRNILSYLGLATAVMSSAAQIQQRVADKKPLDAEFLKAAIDPSVFLLESAIGKDIPDNLTKEIVEAVAEVINDHKLTPLSA